MPFWKRKKHEVRPAHEPIPVTWRQRYQRCDPPLRIQDPDGNKVELIWMWDHYYRDRQWMGKWVWMDAKPFEDSWRDNDPTKIPYYI